MSGAEKVPSGEVGWWTFFDTDPYAGFEFQQIPRDLQGWGSTHPVFTAVIDALKPKTIIEVGSWKGASAIRMAKLCQARQLAAKVICVDTWLGAAERYISRRESPAFYRDLGLRHGFPTLYYTFLANACHEKVQDFIVPLPQTSLNAARIFQALGVKADLIYVDASHDYQDVKLDLEAYFPCLRPGGVLFGDDFETWPGVTRAVTEFTRANGLPLMATRGKYAFAKGASIVDVFREGGVLSPAGDVAGLTLRG